MYIEGFKTENFMPPLNIDIKKYVLYYVFISVLKHIVLKDEVLARIEFSIVWVQLF